MGSPVAGAPQLSPAARLLQSAQHAESRTRQVLIVRHGQTAWNHQGRIQGHADPPLDRTGRRQARALSRDLARSWTPTLVIASDLWRARQTAALIARTTGCLLELHPGLREVDAGRWEGRLRAEVQAEDPDGFASWRGGLRPAPGSAETIAEAGARVLATLGHIAGAADGPGPIVVVGHGLALQAALNGPHLANGEWVEVAVSAPALPAAWMSHLMPGIFNTGRATTAGAAT
jgi:probable phosphoglycerate mutase